MSINISLFIQALAFFAVAWLVMKFGWPGIIGAIEERQKKIADGLAAADRGQKDLADANSKSEQIIREARERARVIEEQASRRSNEAIESAKQAATAEGARIVSSARDEATARSSIR